MQKYTLYLINDEVVEHYYHKSNLLYDFLRKYNSSMNDEVYMKQFDYITKEIPCEKLLDFIKQQVRSHFLIEAYRNELAIASESMSLRFRCDQKECMVISSSLHDVEKLLFEHLRAFHHAFFVVNQSENQFGWLSPLRKRMIL
ncbi:sporulation inhibitor of replication protein SirA [Salinibacillus xinjiangensis]|nr:sporulation inhibitor of replication protein SirA [Salinibacillus xinjiangensis]